MPMRAWPRTGRLMASAASPGGWAGAVWVHLAG
jgi:hypothetical protein